MLSIIKQLFAGKSRNAPLQELLASGATVLDVRTKEEFAGGHVPRSINIPLQQLDSGLTRLRKQQVLVVCCRSGNRSAQAKAMLEARGFTHVVNGGSWQNVKQHIPTSR